MALPVVTFFTVVADGGLGASLAKERSHDRTVWNTAFYVMLALGVVVAGIVNLCGFGLAALMHEPRLHALLGLLSFNFLFIAVSTLPSARLFQRKRPRLAIRRRHRGDDPRRRPRPSASPCTASAR